MTNSQAGERSSQDWQAERLKRRGRRRKGRRRGGHQGSVIHSQPWNKKGRKTLIIKKSKTPREKA